MSYSNYLEYCTYARVKFTRSVAMRQSSVGLSAGRVGGAVPRPLAVRGLAGPEEQNDDDILEIGYLMTQRMVSISQLHTTAHSALDLQRRLLTIESPLDFKSKVWVTPTRLAQAVAPPHELEM